MLETTNTKAFIFASLLLVAAISCKRPQKSQFKANNDVVLDTIEYSNRYFIDNNNQNPACILFIRYIYPKSIANSDEKAVQQLLTTCMFGSDYDSLTVDETIARYWENYVLNYRNESVQYRENLIVSSQYAQTDHGHDHDHDHEMDSDAFFSFHETLTDSVVYNHYGLMSFQVRLSNTKGDNPAFVTNKNLVVNLNTGKSITEEEIFITGYDTALQKLIQSVLFEKNKVKSIQELEDLGYFGIDEIIPNKNFLVTDKGIVYTFNAGEYSAFPLGAQEILLPYDAIRHLLRENTGVAMISKL